MKTKDDLILVEPDVTDQMPKEVATAMLSAPKAKLTNAFRKKCKRARLTVYKSVAPFVSKDKVFYVAPAKDALIRNRLEPRPLATLSKWLRRLIARRAQVQKYYVALEGLTVTGHAERQRDSDLSILSAQAHSLDATRETLEDELSRRGVSWRA